MASSMRANAYDVYTTRARDNCQLSETNEFWPQLLLHVAAGNLHEINPLHEIAARDDRTR